MVFICEAAQCYSHTSKLKNVEKYPWMKDIKWVKWPRKDTVAVARWKRLIRRGGKVKDGYVVDELNVTRRSRLCSRHFDPGDINMWGNTAADPKYFKWNNWGNPVEPTCRSTGTLSKLAPVQQPEPAGNTVDISVKTTVVPEIGVASKQINNIGRKL